MDNIQWIGDYGIGIKTFSIDETSTEMSKYPRKLFLGPSVVFAHHRNGWNYQLSVLRPLATTNPDNSVWVDGCVDATFTYYSDVYPSEAQNIAHTKPWIGFVHNPPALPTHLAFYLERSNQLFMSLLNNSDFIKSLPFCKGLITFSKHLANHIRQVMPTEYQNIPIENFYLPTEPCQEALFSMDRFEHNDNKCIVQIGWWARKQLSIYFLQLLEGSVIKKKVRLIALCTNESVSQCMQDELSSLDNEEQTIFEQRKHSVEVLEHIDNDEYDSLLSMNIAFADYWDCSASNLIIECIVRHTPILVRRHPALIEYLGDGYPFFFDDLKEASAMLCDMKLIKTTYKYLRALSLTKTLSPEAFLENFVASDIYKNLPTPFNQKS